ncbi:DUF2798 domain-containing protein [Bordetella petrii]|uniref:DUF2798 domain-containing protein n=1 Tax=Bordetella petrii TaxID=94624 RepID=UPI001A97B6FE|nr:DUF2798 domain-containing protein [Bordetella petrii]MBO1111394.1 DUF2798 domain-containing protein [Bordetella petrii]
MSYATRLRFIFALLMSCLMSMLMTGWVSWMNLGLGPHFAAQWARAFAAAWPAAFAIVLAMGPAVQRASQRLVAPRPGEAAAGPR